MTSRVPALIVHGGAGADPGGREELREGVRDAVIAGWRALAGGGTALDAVEAAVRPPRGPSALQCRAGLRPDRSRHRGNRRVHHGRRPAPEWGGGGGLGRPAIRSRWPGASSSPGRHSLFGAGPRALTRAEELGVAAPPTPAKLVTEPPAPASGRPPFRPGTVGAVALDRRGTIAAATSTGGTSGKLPGRVGDSALIGCGTYAESTLGGVSCTGDGEAIIRVTLARRALDIMKRSATPATRARSR